MGSQSVKDFSKLNFDIDEYLDPIVPRSRLYALPRPIAHFLGYRDTPGPALGNVPVAIWGCIGGICGTAALSGLFMANFIEGRGAPIIIGSYGATAILEYNAIASPFSQPRNAVFGHFISALVGVCFTKLFALNADFENLRWVAGSLAVGVASALMTLTNTVHPPAGATAVLAAISPDISQLGWFYLAVILLSSVVTVAVACILNNINRQFPIYWWTPRKKVTEVKKNDDAEKKAATPQDELAIAVHDKEDIAISIKGVQVPEHIQLSPEEKALLKTLTARLRDTKPESASDTSATSTNTIDYNRDAKLYEEKK